MIALLLLACRQMVTSEPGVLVVAQEQKATWQRNFNPLLTTGMARWPTTAGIYEPLLIYNPMQGEYTPWLALAAEFNSQATELTVSLRPSVRWSDGEVFDADDVVSTFELLREHPALDSSGLWNRLSAVTQLDSYRVQFLFKEPTFSGLHRVAHQPIVPQHIWSEVDDPVRDPNVDPVGTGPFTEVLSFRNQSWDLGANPHYWQELGVERLRFPALPSNESANLALLHDELDWAGNFVPAIDRIFVEKDPEHHHYWFPLVGASVLLYPNHTRPPLDDVRVRKALSMAIDRSLLVAVALHNYTEPADESGLSVAFDRWKMADWQQRERWTEHSPKKAIQLLEEAGWILESDGKRRKAGQTLTLNVGVVSGWSDWVRAAQVVSRSLEMVGVQTEVDNRDFGSWFQRLQTGDFDLSLGWSPDGANTIAFYESMLSQQKVMPVGEAAPVNWHRYGHPEAAQLVSAFESTAELEEQIIVAQRLQQIFVEQAPALPLFLNPSWGECNTLRFTGFPSAENPYARLSPNHPPESLLVLTQLEAR